MCGPDRHVAQGVPGHDHRPAGRRARDGLGCLFAGGVRRTGRGSCGCTTSRRWSMPSRSGPLCGVGETRHEHRSGRDRRVDVEPSASITSSLCRTWRSRPSSPRGSWPWPGGAAKNAWLQRLGRGARGARGRVLAANARDVAAAPGLGSNAAAIDRLTLDPEADRGDGPGPAATSPRLPDPIGEIVASSRRPNGLEVRQVRVPLGVIFMIYESRPNVTRRRRRTLRQERQRGDPPRRQGGHPHQPGAAPHPGRRAGHPRPARARRPARRDDRPRRRRRAAARCPSSSTWRSRGAARA